MERELFTLLLAVLDRLPEARRRPAWARCPSTCAAWNACAVGSPASS
ncbi:MAG: hypothetical protein AAF288_14365 [Planctomycetota bacterium]